MASTEPQKSLSVSTVDHARQTATIFEAMLEKVAVSGTDGRQSERRGSLRQSNTRDESIGECARKNCLRDPNREFSGRFLLDTHFCFRAVLLDTPIRVEMEISCLASSKPRKLLDTYFDPCLLDTQMQKLPSDAANVRRVRGYCGSHLSAETLWRRGA
jgi:hypothetical protein